MSEDTGVFGVLQHIIDAEDRRQASLDWCYHYAQKLSDEGSLNPAQNLHYNQQQQLAEDIDKDIRLHTETAVKLLNDHGALPVVHDLAVQIRRLKTAVQRLIDVVGYLDTRDPYDKEIEPLFLRD